MNPRQLSLRITTVIALIMTLVFLHVRADDTAPSPAIGADNFGQMEAIASFKGGLAGSNTSVTTNGFKAGLSNGVITLLNTRTGETEILPPNNDIERLLGVSPDGQYLVYVSLSSTDLLLRQTHSAETVTIFTKAGSQYYSQISSIIFSADAKRLLIMEKVSGISHQWDVQTGKEIFYDSTLGIVLRQASYSPDGTSLLNYSGDAWTVLDTITGKTLLRVPVTDSNNAAQFMPDGKTLVVYQPQQIELWNIQRGEKSAGIPPEAGTYWDAFQIAPDGNVLATYTKSTGAVSVWFFDDLGQPALQGRLYASSSEANSFKVNSKLVALYGQYSKEIRLMDIATGAISSIKMDQGSGPTNIALSKDGKLVFVVENAYAGKISVWLLQPLKVTKQLTLPGSNFSLSADGTTLHTWFTYYDRKDYQERSLSTIYAIPSATRPRRSTLVMADVIPNVINVRSKPEGDAPVLGVAGGLVFLGGRDLTGKYVYLPDYHGWVRSDATYIKLRENFSIDQLLFLNPADVVTEAITPVPTQPKPTRTPRPTLAPTATPGIAQLPSLDATVLPEVSTAPQDYQPITLANADQVRLLGVYNIAGYDSYHPLNVQIDMDANRLFGQNGSYNNFIYSIWDLRTLTQVGDGLQVASNYNTPNIAGTSQDGSLVAYYSYESGSNYISVLDVEKQAEIFRTPNVPYQYGSVRVLFNRDASLMAVKFPTRNPQVWDLQNKTLRFETPTGDPFFSADGQVLVVNDGYFVRQYDAASGNELKITPIVMLENPLVTHLSDDLSTLVWASYTQFETVDLKNNTTAIHNLGVSNGNVSVQYFSFNANNSLMLVRDSGNILHLFDTQSGSQLATWKLNQGSGAAFSPDSRFIVTSNPLQFINLADGSIIPLPGHYIGNAVKFTPDATSLVVSDDYTSMVFGIPNAQRPGWQPVVAHVKSSGISVRAIPDQGAKVIGYAKGDVKVGGRKIGGSGAVYLPELGGWVWSDSNYLTLDTPFDLLPIISSDPQP